LFDATTLQPIRAFPSEPGSTMELAFSRDGKHLAGVVATLDMIRLIRDRVPLEQGCECEALIWDVATGKTLERRPKVSAWAWSADGKVVASADLDLVVQVWNLGSDKVRFRSRRLPGVVSGMTFSPCGRWLGAWWQQINFAAVAARKTAPEEIFKSGVVF